MSPKKKKQKAKPRGGDPANLEKSRERTKQHLVPGRKPEKTLTIPQLEYCAWRARGATIADAGRLAEIKKSNIYTLEHRELTQRTIEEFKEKHKDAAIERVDELKGTIRIAAASALIDGLRHWKTHFRRGDDARAKLIDTGCKVGGLIESSKVIAQANAAAKSDSTNQLYAKRLYLPDWRRETIERLEKEGAEAPQ